MSDNPLKDYKDAFRANLPSGMTYDSDIARYFVNDHRFAAPWTAEDYLNYLIKFGFETLSIYSVAGFEPSLVFDFGGEFYRTGGTTSTFTDAITHSRSGNATMVDSDGLLKWAPHNLVLNSATPATQSISVVSGANYTVECTGISIALSGAGSGTVTEGNPVTITASTTTLTLTVTGSTGTMWTYRSDLGGMVDNPDRGDSYVPTTSSAVYLPRRGHHVYNGSAWVNEGLLHESEARTNLLFYSTPNTTNWTTLGATLTENASVGAGGQTTTSRLSGSGSLGTQRTGLNTTVTGNAVYSVKVRKDSTHRFVQIIQASDGTFYQNYDLLTGSLGTAGAGVVNAGIEDEGDFWRIFVAFNIVTSAIFYIYLAPSASAAYGQASDTSDYIDIDHVQLEAGLTPSSTIPTSGATVTRAADSRSTNAANMPYDATAMSWASDMLITYADTNTATEATLLDWSADANNSIKLTLDTASTKAGTLTLTVTKAGTSVSVDAPAELTPGLNQPLKVAWRVTTSEINIALNGTAATAVSNIAGVPDLSTANGIFGGMIVAALDRGWANDLGDAGIAEAGT